jgi:hypothetical protein
MQKKLEGPNLINREPYDSLENGNFQLFRSDATVITGINVLKSQSCTSSN